MNRPKLVFALFTSALVLGGCDDDDPGSDSSAVSMPTTPEDPTGTEPGPGPVGGGPEPDADTSEPEPAAEPEPTSGPTPTEPEVNPEPAGPAVQPEPAPEPQSAGGGGSPTTPANGGTDPGPAPMGGGSQGGNTASNGGDGPTSGGSGGASDPDSSGCDAALLCDDFEDDASGMAPGAPWTVDVNGGAVEVSSERAFSGSNSVRVSNTQGGYKRAFFSVSGDPVFPAAGQQMYGRMMMWLTATPAGSVHWTFIQGEGPSDDGSYDIYYRYGGQHEGRLMANFETNGRATDCWDHSATVMPTQTWTCLEWRFDTSSDEMQFWLDGEELSDIHVVGSGEGCVSQDLGGAWPAPQQFDVLRLGWEKYQESSELSAWIDDVAVSSERVGCPQR